MPSFIHDNVHDMTAPMDLGTMRGKVDEGAYDKADEMRATGLGARVQCHARARARARTRGYAENTQTSANIL